MTYRYLRENINFKNTDMKHLKKTLLLLLLLFIVINVHAASPKHEMRAAWVATAWNLDWPSSNSLTASAQQAELRAIIDKLHAANFNTVFFQVRSFSDAFYKSSYEPWSYYLTGTRGKDPGYDPLKVAIEYAHSLGMELHAWVNPYRYSSSNLNYGTLSNDYAKTHPDWIMHSSSNQYTTILNPGIPEVREQIAKVIAEIVTNYDVDGVIFDDYFYINGATQDTEDAKYYNQYNPNGLSLADWRRTQVNEMVKLVHTTIKNIKPYCRFGISPAGVAGSNSTVANKYGVSKCPVGSDWQYDGIYSDPLAWVSSKTIDYISPQIYWNINHSTNDYDQLCNWWSVVANKFGRHFYSSHTLSNLTSWGDDEYVNEVACNRAYDRNNGAPGSAFYNISNGLESTTFMNYIKSNSFSSPAIVPVMNWYSATTLVAPSNVVLSGTTLSWSHATAERFTVYAFNKGDDIETALTSATNLVGVVYGKSINVSNVTGYANKAFAVCAYDRYGNEYTPGLYNAASQTPVITPAVSSVRNTMKENATSSEYTDVIVVGQYLAANMTIETNNNYVTVTTQSGWNDLTGGTLRIATKTGLAVDTYSTTITIKSGTASATIIATSVINPLVPMINASTSSASLNYKVNVDAVPYKDVTITAEELATNMEVTCSNSFVTATPQSNWNARTGGTLRIVPQAGLTAGTYTSVVTIKSGTISKNIAVTVLVKALEPTIGASVSSVAIVGKLNVTPAPYQDIKITAQDLSTDMTITCTNAAVDITPQAGWNTRTGGTLRITMDTSKETGSYTGTITISDGTVSRVINVKATINNLEPVVSALINSVNIAGAAGDNVYRDVMISAANLSEDLKVDCTNQVVTVTKQSNWNDRAGGTLRLTLNTENTVGNYEGALTVASGETKTEISVSATIDATVDTEEEEEPYMKATPRIVEFAVKEGAPNPTQNVSITTANLSRKYTINVELSNTISSVIAYDALDVTYQGGTLVLTADASAKPGTYNGTVTITATRRNNTATAIIDVMLVVVENNPIITPSTPAITFEAEQFAEAPYEDVFIMASDVVSAIEINSTSLPVTITKLEDWNELTGGTFRVALNTDADIDTYSGNIVISSGSTEVLLPVSATITAVPPKDGTITFNSTAIWSKTTSDVSYITLANNNRSMAYYDGRLYIADKALGGYHVVDAATGNLEETISVGYTDFAQHNLRITQDGQMLFGNTGSASTNAIIRLRSWNMTTNVMSELTKTSITGRSDYFYSYGDWNKSGFLLALANTGALVKIPYLNGEVQLAETLTPITLTSTPKSAKAIPVSATAFYATATHNIPVKYSLENSKVLEEFGVEKPMAVGASGLGCFTLHGHNYLITLTDSLGGFEIFDVTNGLEQAHRIITPVEPLGTTDNSAMTIDFCTHVDGNDAYIYQLVPNNGLRAYKFTFTPQSLETQVETTIVEKNVRVCATSDGVEVVFEDVELVSIYSINGTLISQGLAAERYACDLQSGIYIIRIGEMLCKFVK